MRFMVLAMLGGALAGCGAAESMGVMATIQTADGRRIEFAGAARVTAGELAEVAAEDPVTGWRLTIRVPPAPGDYVLGKEHPTVSATWTGATADATSGMVSVLTFGAKSGQPILGTLTDVHLAERGREVGVVAAGTFSARVP